jgi:AraC-like DNA-binding protein
LLARGTSHTISSDPNAQAHSIVSFDRMLERRGASVAEPLHVGGEGSRTRLVCGSFELRGSDGPPLLSLLPPLIHLPAHDVRANDGASAVLAMIGREARSTHDGADAVLARLADVLFVKVVQECLARDRDAGWLTALRDPSLAQAIALMHERPNEVWTVARLARAVGMSRSSFAARFGAVVREGPVRYLTRYRLHQAARELRQRAKSLMQIATRTGYASEAALSRAFKREFGLSPASYRRNATSS